MIQLRSILKPADNSGAKRLSVIGFSTRIGKTASVGDVVNCVVKRGTELQFCCIINYELPYI